MPSLRQCFEKHGCDRSKHGYDLIYQTLKPPVRMLEIGIFKGAGIASWLDFFPAAQIVGLDTFQRVAPETVKILKHPRVTWFQGDSRDIHIPGQFDLIIDDGDHRSASQRRTFENLSPLLSAYGVYFIEDCRPADPNFYNLLGALDGFQVKQHDLRKGHLFDSFLLEIRPC